MDEIRKIPPVTRFLCGASLGVTLPVMLQIVSPYKVIFVKELVTRRYEVGVWLRSCSLSVVGLPSVCQEFCILLWLYVDESDAQRYCRSGELSPASSSEVRSFFIELRCCC